MLLTIALIPIITIAQNDASVIAGKNIAIVQTESGKVKGYIHNGIYTYKGIPYAKAARFMAPSKPDAWAVTRSSMSYGPVCPTDPTTSTYDEFEFPFQHDWGYTNENCLSLNVWTQKINDNK
jgi:para-nitrobenzyl esterase